MNEWIDFLAEAAVFYTLDDNSGCCEVEIDKRALKMTAFTLHHELYLFIRMSFGLENSPGTFQRTMNVTFAAVKWKFTLVHLNDIVIYSRSPEEHIGYLRGALTLLNDVGVSLRLPKFKFFTKTIDHHCHVKRQSRLGITSDTKNATRGLQPPSNLTQLRSFLGS